MLCPANMVVMPRIFGLAPLAMQQISFLRDELDGLRSLPWPMPRLASFFGQTTMDANDVTSRQCEFRGFHIMLRYPCATPTRLTSQFVRQIKSDFPDENAMGSGVFGDVNKVLYSLEGKSVWTEMRERLLCFEYVPDKSIREHISDGIERRVRYEMARGISSSLNYLHMERDIAHMDLKPENILLDDNILPNIADFGLSRLFGKNGSRIITTSRAGTLEYMLGPEYPNRGLMQMNPSNSWPLVTWILKVVWALGILFVIGLPLVLYLQNLSCSWPRMILTAIGAAVATVLVLLNPNGPWSWVVVVMTLQVITAAKTLVAFGFETAFLTLYCLQYFGNFWVWVILVFGVRVLATILDAAEEKLAPVLLLSFQICTYCWVLQLYCAVITRCLARPIFASTGPDMNDELCMKQEHAAI